MNHTEHIALPTLLQKHRYVDMHCMKLGARSTANSPLRSVPQIVVQTVQLLAFPLFASKQV
jgi:hypothetical protein